MKQEAIAALEQFKQMHLATDGQVDTMSESPKVNLSRVPKKINYPAHVKPLKERIMSALNNGCRTPDSVATYCSEEIKLITLQLGRWVSRGLIGKHTNVVSGITRYYPHDIAKEKGFLVDPQPIVRKKGKKAKLKTENRSSSVDKPVQPPAPIRAKENDYIAFLENRVTAWAQESRKQAHEITKLQDALIEARKTRDVTSEVTEVMQEVTKLRATVAYLESKLFGSK
jgi:hypothetical protein